MEYNIKTEQKNISDKLNDLTSKIQIINQDSIKEAIKQAKLEVNKWQKVDNIVCVFSDLQKSTQISFDKQKKTVAKILESLIVPMQKIHESFGSEFIDIKGDGGIILYSGENASTRAFLASVTCNTFFKKHICILENTYDIEFNVFSGIHQGSLLLKRVGSRTDNFPVWAGETVNMSALITKELKDMSTLTRNSSYIGVTQEIYSELSKTKYSDYLIKSCGCHGGHKNNLWKVQHIQNGKAKKYHYMNTNWCDTHGQEYLNKVLQCL